MSKRGRRSNLQMKHFINSAGMTSPARTKLYLEEIVPYVNEAREKHNYVRAWLEYTLEKRIAEGSEPHSRIPLFPYLKRVTIDRDVPNFDIELWPGARKIYPRWAKYEGHSGSRSQKKIYPIGSNRSKYPIEGKEDLSPGEAEETSADLTTTSSSNKLEYTDAYLRKIIRDVGRPPEWQYEVFLKAEKKLRPIRYLTQNIINPLLEAMVVRDVCNIQIEDPEVDTDEFQAVLERLRLPKR